MQKPTYEEMGYVITPTKYVPNDYPDEAYDSYAEMMKAHPEFREMEGAQYHVENVEE